MKTLLQLLLIGVVIMCFNKCYTSDKATKAVNKADAKYPEIVAKLARDKYPCSDLLKPDTTILYQDSLIWIECPDSNYSSNDYGSVYTGGIDTTGASKQWDSIVDRIKKSQSSLQGNSKTVRVPVKILVPSKVINNWYEDSAKIKIAAADLAKCQKSNETLQASNDSLSKKIARKSKENWIWRIIALALIAWQVIRLWKNITTIKVR